MRVRVRGLPPRASDAQFISHDLVIGAQTRPSVAPLPDEPLVVGLDVARGGADECVFRFRRGLDAASLKPVRMLGEEARDSMRLVSTAADILSRTCTSETWPERQGLKVTTMFVDATGVGGPIADRLAQLGHRNVVQVQFGGRSPDPQCESMRAHMWARLREWLERGRIDRDPQLEADLTGTGYAHNKRDKLVLEAKESMKRRGLASPDHGDALVLSRAYARRCPIAPLHHAALDLTRHSISIANAGAAAQSNPLFGHRRGEPTSVSTRHRSGAAPPTEKRPGLGPSGR